MAEISLIDIDNVKGQRLISENIAQDKFDAFVKVLQRNQLRNLLGDAMYYDLFLNVTDINTIAAPYNDLVNGTTYTYQGYTIYYYGLKPYLSWLFLIDYIFEGDHYYADYGNIAYADNPQDNTKVSSYRSKKEIKDGHEQQANHYKCEIIKFLQENISTYTLWKQKYQPPDNRSRIIRNTIHG